MISAFDKGVVFQLGNGAFSDFRGRLSLKVTSIRHFQTDTGAAGASVPIREKAHSGISPAGAAIHAARSAEGSAYYEKGLECSTECFTRSDRTCRLRLLRFRSRFGQRVISFHG